MTTVAGSILASPKPQEQTLKQALREPGELKAHIEKLCLASEQSARARDYTSLSAAVEALAPLPLPTELLTEQTNHSLSYKAEAHLGTAIHQALIRNDPEALRILSTIDAVARTLIRNRHALSSMAPPNSDAEQLILTEIAFAPCPPVLARKRCALVLRDYRRTQLTDHRRIGNLCYEARAVTRSIEPKSDTPEQKRTLKAALQMLLVLGVDANAGEATFYQAGSVSIRALADRAGLYTKLQGTTHAALPRTIHLSPSSRAGSPSSAVRQAFSEDALNESHLTDLELMLLTPADCARLLAERLRPTHVESPNRAPSVATLTEKQHTMTHYANEDGHTTKANQMPTVHLIYDIHGELERVTQLDDDAWMADSEGRPVETNVPFNELMDVIGDGFDWSDLSKGSWHVVAQNLDRYLALTAANAHQNEPLFESIPPDLPPALAEGRLKVILNHGSEADLRAKRALTELVMAAKEHRQPNKDYLSDTTDSKTWDSLYQNDLDTLHQEQQHLTKAAMNIKDNPEQHPNSKGRVAVMEQLASEINQCIETYFGDGGPSDSQPTP